MNCPATTGDFRYADFFVENAASARRIVPILLSIIPKPGSVVDLGGGTGAWCSVMREHGVSRVTCVDDPRIPAGQLLVRPEEFIPCDLADALPRPIPCDLALCLEVAEHLPENRADAVVDFLTSSAGLVLFSAAIPGQPHHRHINEQPPLYWKELFAQRGFSRHDVIRPRIIGDTEISYWYRQNLYFYADAVRGERLQEASTAFPCIPDDFELVNSRVLETYRAPCKQPGLRRFLAGLLPAIRESFSARRESGGKK